MNSRSKVHRALGLLLLIATCHACVDRGGAVPAAEPSTSAVAARLLPDAGRWDVLQPELRQRLVESPHVFFRFVNRAWMQQVCDAFGPELQVLPAVRLHGDPHVEQYAFTAEAHGLDDFDDSAIGPAVIDLVRFLGSVQIVAHQRGWTDVADHVGDQLFHGYRQALETPGYAPPEPSIVARLRATAPPSRVAFLAYAESLMQPMTPEVQARLEAAWPLLKTYIHQADPTLSLDFLHVKRAGHLVVGVGSSIGPKILARIEGPTAAMEDDLVIEAKQVNTLRGVTCLTVAAGDEVLRVLEGVSHIGRIHHEVLAVLPNLGDGPGDWWVKSWDSSYREVTIGDLVSPVELAELALDVGAQLGGTNLLDVGEDDLAQQRKKELESVTRLEPPIRELARHLAAATLEAWEVARGR